MITFSAVFSLLVLSVVAAVVSSHGVVPNTHESDRSKFTPRFFRVEKFYRNFFLNLSFAGISLSIASGKLTGVTWDILNPMNALVLGLLIITVVPYVLHDEQQEIAKQDLPRIIGWGLAAILAFAFAISCHIDAPTGSRDTAKDQSQSQGKQKDDTGH